MKCMTSLEERTLQIGRELFERIAQQDDAGGGWLDRSMMSLAMRDEQVKAQLFRFVDVLPVLRTPAQVSSHLREYLLEAAHRLPGGMGRVVPFIPRRKGLLARAVAKLANVNAQRMGRRFIAASDIPQTISAVASLRSKEMTFTIDLLGEAVLSASEALAYQRQYLDLISALADQAAGWRETAQVDRGADGAVLPRVNVSVKLSSLYSQFDPIDPEGTSRAVRDRLRPILRLARSRGVFVNVDMEQYAFKDLTLRIFREIFAEAEFANWPDVGIAIQAYLKCCGEDLAALNRWAQHRGTPIWVRLVKGAYWDFETVIAAQNGWPTPVFDEKAATDANYEAQTRYLLDHRQTLRPAIASHNVRSIAHALALAEERGVPARAFEFQMLHGMADPIKAALVQMGHRVRIYTPYGQLLPGMAYLVRRLLENTSNDSFLRAGFLENQAPEQLLMNPLQRLLKPRVQPVTADGSLGPFRNEPLADFSQESSRERMKDALRYVHGQMDADGRPAPLVIGGKRVTTGQTLESIDPSHSRRVVGRVCSATAEHARQAIVAAHEAFKTWRDVAPSARAGYLVSSADIMRRRRWELAAWEVFETGKPWREADGDVAEAIDYCDFYAREMVRLSEPQSHNVPGENNVVHYEPRGVAAIIAPWNFPLAILCGMTAAAVVTGNTAIMKPAEQSPIIAAKLMEVFEEAGLPPGVVNFLPGVGEEVGPVLVEHRDVAIIAFTGSRAVGLEIQRKAGELRQGQHLIKRVITEMGGKNAVIVDDDADLDEAVHGVTASAFGYAGQKCSACSRVIVLSSIYDAFVPRLIEATRSLRIGPANEPGTFVGPVIDPASQKRIMETIERGKGEATLAYSADVSELVAHGCFVPPTIFVDVPPGSALGQEEIFGPVLAVVRATDLTQALAIANGTPYALTGGLFSRSPVNVERVRREFRVGNLYINRKITGALVDRQPFGGFKLSGVGSKAGGTDYLQQFMWPRVTTENTLRRGFAPVNEPAAVASVGE